MRSSNRERRFEQLVHHAGPKVLAYLLRRCDPRTDAADVHQRVRLTTWRRFDDLPTDDDGQVAWMVAVARRELANHRRSQARRTAAFERLVHLIERLPQTDDAPRAQVDQLLDGLEEIDREIVTLTYWEGLTSEQVATVVELSAAAVRKRLQRCRTTMRALLGTPTSVS